MTAFRPNTLATLLSLLLLADLVCCGLVVRQLANAGELAQRGQLATGQVMDVDREPRRHVLVVRYTPVGGKQLTGGTTRYRKSDVKVGLTIQIRYDPDEPLRFQTADWKPDRTLLWVLLIALAAAVVLLLDRLVRQLAGAAKRAAPEDGAGMR